MSAPNVGSQHTNLNSRFVTDAAREWRSRRMIKEEAIEILSDMRAEYNIFSDDEEEATRYHALSWAIQALNEQQRTGRWIGRELGYCSCCGHEGCASDIWSGCKKDHMFCPNCGAQMEVEE